MLMRRQVGAEDFGKVLASVVLSHFACLFCVTLLILVTELVIFVLSKLFLLPHVSCIRLLQVYQIYARQSAEEVHRLLRSIGADYVVLEDSICYERRHSRGCRLRDLLDLANGHVGHSPQQHSQFPQLSSCTH